MDDRFVDVYCSNFAWIFIFVFSLCLSLSLFLSLLFFSRNFFVTLFKLYFRGWCLREKERRLETSGALQMNDRFVDFYCSNSSLLLFFSLLLSFSHSSIFLELLCPAFNDILTVLNVWERKTENWRRVEFRWTIDKSTFIAFWLFFRHFLAGYLISRRRWWKRKIDSR